MCLEIQILWLDSFGVAEGGRLKFQEKLHGLGCYPPPWKYSWVSGCSLASWFHFQSPNKRSRPVPGEL